MKLKVKLLLKLAQMIARTSHKVLHEFKSRDKLVNLRLKVIAQV